MIANRNDGYYPQDPAGGHWLQRLVRWAFECRHKWSITSVNGFGLPSEAQCLKCGMYRHRILKANDLPKVAEWQMGRHPKSDSANAQEMAAAETAPENHQTASSPSPSSPCSRAAR